MKVIRHLGMLALLGGALLVACSSGEDTAPAEVAPPASQTAVGPSAMQVVAATTSYGGARDENGWYHDWNEGLAAALEQHKPVLIDFYADWCEWCKVMDEVTFSDSTVAAKLADRWVSIRIDTENVQASGMFRGESKNYNEMATFFGVQGLPSFLFIDKNGEPITVVSGYHEAPGFMVILDFIEQEIYKLPEEDQQKFIESHPGNAS